jgi:hypothetical protein
MMFSIMLEDLGLQDVRYNCHTHEDDEAAIVTFYGPSRITENLLQQLEIGGAPTTNSEEAEDSPPKHPRT